MSTQEIPEWMAKWHYGYITSDACRDEYEKSLAAAKAEGARQAWEKAAALHEDIDPRCDHDGGPGAGAMGAVIRYRDELRRHAADVPEPPR